MRHVIIGNSTAGIAACEAIRSLDKKGSITVVSDEPYHAYSRPLITYWLAGKVGDREMYYKGRSYFRKLGVSEILGREAVKLDTVGKVVVLEDGRRLSYDRLLLASGGKPIIPPVKGGDLGGVFTFAKWDDAKSVRSYINKNKVDKVVVVGGGLIGLKTTEALVELGLDVTVLERSDRILSATFDGKASQLMLDYLLDKGVEVLTENTVEGVVGGKGKVSGVILKDGRKLSCGMVVLAIGVKPNIDLTEGTEIKTNKGVLTDRHMETSVSGVFAAGDVVEAYDTSVDAPRTIAIWPLAVRQGRIAGLNMAGERVEYHGGFPMNSVEIHGLPTISAGVTDPKESGYSTVEEYKPEESVYRKVVLKDGKIKGIVFVGRIERAGIFTGLIESGLDVSKLKEHLLHDDFGLITLPREYRKHLVTGVGMDV